MSPGVAAVHVCHMAPDLKGMFMRHHEFGALRTAPHRTAPHRAAPRRTAPHRTAPRRTAPRTRARATRAHRASRAPHRTAAPPAAPPQHARLGAGVGLALGESSTNGELCASAIVPLLEHVAAGGASTAFMYGQTGSGKTHTMAGIEQVAAATLLPAGCAAASARLQYFEAQRAEAREACGGGPLELSLSRARRCAAIGASTCSSSAARS